MRYLPLILGLFSVLSATSCAGDPPIVIVEPRFPVVDGSYAPNLCRRIHANGSLRTSVTMSCFGATVLGKMTADALVDGSDGSAVHWKISQPGDEFGFTVNVDLGESYRINKVRVNWWHPSNRPRTWKVSVSSDGENFTQIKESFAADIPNATDEYWNVRFSPLEVQYIRVEGSGMFEPEALKVSLGEICAFLSDDAPPPAIGQGYSLGFMQGTEQVLHDQTPAWMEGTNILGGPANPIASIRPRTGWDKDSVVDFDLGAAYEVSMIKVGDGIERPCWKNGCKLEVSSGVNGPWQLLWQTTEAIPIKTLINVPPELAQIRKARITSFGSAGTGVNPDRVRFIEFFAPVSSGSEAVAFAQVPAEEGEKVSAGIYDQNGQLVKTLLVDRSATGGDVSLYWDGTDAYGQVLPLGEYQWRAITNASVGRNIAAVGDSGRPPYGVTEALGGVTGVTHDAEGNFYQCAWFVEQHTEVRKSAPDGGTIWNAKQVGALTLAADQREVFISVSPDGKLEDRVYRLNATDGTPIPFPHGRDYIVVNPERPAKREVPDFSPEATFEFEPLNGLALDATRLFVSNYIKDRVEIFDRQTGAKIGDIQVEKPLGLAYRGDQMGGVLWVASGDRVRHFRHGFGLRWTEVPEKALVGGVFPQAVNISPQGHEIAVSDIAEGTVRTYAIDTAGSGTLIRQVGQAASAGVINDGDFRPGYRLGVALDSNGHLTVADSGNRSLWVYDNTGTLISTEFGEFQPRPVVFEANGDTHRLLSGPWEYEVNLAGTQNGGPRWHGGGTWRLAANWTPLDKIFADAQQAIRMKIQGRDYIFYLGHRSRGVAIYQIEEGRMRRSFIFGTRWYGLDELEPEKFAMWTWRDKNGNGLMDWNPEDVEDNQEGVFMERPAASGSGLHWELRAPGCYVDGQGNLWFARVNAGIVKVPLQGFDDCDNPIYDFTTPQVIVPRDTSPEQYIANNLKVSADGEIYALGFSRITGGDPYLWMGGKEIRRYSSTGTLLGKFFIPDRKTAVTFAFDAVNPDIFYTVQNEGDNPEFRAWNKEGLCLASAKPNLTISGNIGWVDGFMGMSTFSPDQQQHFLYAEDVWNGKSVLFEFQNLNEVDRYSGRLILQEAQ